MEKYCEFAEVVKNGVEEYIFCKKHQYYCAHQRYCPNRKCVIHSADYLKCMINAQNKDKT